ncbi:hypothetical protein C8D87_11873 [Lentzea atacamensis]|uniref:Phytanoyl-CoA dioxygenase (PhyH) n=1 Tax=Lentzea atacamensis TaxID=531938 RepID=A0ABX9DVB8_9PSEU|nr:hypothetical protein C8D87_11873 [Lentzea atacamensis]
MSRCLLLKSLIVVDDFYFQPVAVREMALRKSQWMPDKEVDGIKYGVETSNSFYTDEIVTCFESLIGCAIDFHPALMGFGVFSMYGEAARVDLTTHYDETEWSAICYLTPDELCQGGLSFYRHRETGLLGPPTDEEARGLGYEDAGDFLKFRYFPDKLDPAAWEKVDEVSMRFNRMVLLQGSRKFHRAASGFGTAPENGRLTQRFFFNERVA